MYKESMVDIDNQPRTKTFSVNELYMYEYEWRYSTWRVKNGNQQSKKQPITTPGNKNNKQ